MAEYIEQQEVQTKLEQMGLTIAGLTRVSVAVAGAYNSTTRFHSSAAAGTYMYHEGTAALRRVCVPEGYDYDEEGHQPRTFNDQLGVSIIFQTGDENTGILTGIEPTTRNPKGTATRDKVSANVEQLALFEFVAREDPEGQSYNWVFLAAVVDGFVRSELSLPREITEDGKPCDWAERIILPEEPLASDAVNTDLDAGDKPDNTSTDDVDIDVAWKQ